MLYSPRLDALHPPTRESVSVESGPPVSEELCSTADHQSQSSDLLPTRLKPRRLFFLWPEKHGCTDTRHRGTEAQMTSIDVGILGATGMVGQQFIALLANHPWFKVDVARRQRAVRGQGVSRRGRLAAAEAACRTTSRARSRRGRHARAARRSWCSPASTVGRRRDRRRLRPGRPHHRQQLAQLPDGRRRAAADSRSQRRSSRAARRAGAARGWKGRIVTNPNCVDRRASRWRWRRCGSSA